VIREVGPHSPWWSRLLESLGHEVIVANGRRVKLIAKADRKIDRVDAETPLHGADTDLFECLVIECATIFLHHEAKISSSAYSCAG
jgi:transposase